MSNHRGKKQAAVARAVNASAPWYKRVWVVASATAVIVSGIFIKGPAILQNARVLPNEVHQTYAVFMSWVKEDVAWTGFWSAFPEGDVDVPDMRLSNTDMQVTISASQGHIDGTIATKHICHDIPLFNYVLLSGSVSGNTAHVVAWDIVMGHKMKFATLTLVRAGDVMTVTPTEGLKDWFPPTARLGRRPDDPGVTPEPSNTFCSAERKAALGRLLHSDQSE